MKDARAVVLGGSLAGMCAARVLSRHFRDVTVVERDALQRTTVGDAEHRRGVPQSRHVHALLVRGREELESLFPGFEAAAKRRGAQELDFTSAFHAFRPHGWEPRAPSGFLSLWGSRTLLEASVRERFFALAADVRLLDATAVRGLEVDGSRVKAVLVEREGGGLERLDADLVVDACGRASKAPEWLSAAGFPLDEETVVDSFGGYASLWLEPPPIAKLPLGGNWKGIWIDGDPPRTRRGGVLFPVEGGRWVVTLGGFEGDHPPSDEAGFRAWARTLRSPLLADAIEHAVALSPVHSSRSFTNRMRHYERWSRPLDGFLAVGDAACAFNPVYGQGMTTTAVCAQVLASELQRSDDPARLARSFHRAQLRFLGDVWSLATGADFLFPSTTGKRPRGAALVHPYFVALTETAIEDLSIRRRFGEVLHLLKPPSALFAPDLVARVVARSLPRRVRTTLRKRTLQAMPAIGA
jgi:2-polyprenyl-6-methoxyphenol hydroxylase-like FAD-dependent oxidoreductase